MRRSRIVRSGSGVAVSILAALVALVLLAHGAVPNVGGYASLIETFLPWFGLAIPLLALAALITFSRVAGVFVLAAAVVWAVTFGPAILPRDPGGTASLTVASENVHADNPVAGTIAQDLADRHPDVIALQELDDRGRAAVSKVLHSAYPHHVVIGTVGLWSTLPIERSQGLTLGLGWKRAVRADIKTGDGTTRVYVVHLASVRPGEHVQRDAMLAALGTTLAADRSGRLMVVGDFNSASTDRSFQAVASHAEEATTTDFGLGFTWPAAFPLARLDHALVRGLTPVSSGVLPANGSDHRGIIVGVK